MSNKKNLRTRIVILYVVYFATLLGGIICTSGPAFKRGARLGVQISDTFAESLDDETLRASHIYIDVPTADTHPIESLELGDSRNTSVTMMTHNLDIIVSQDATKDMPISQFTFHAIGNSVALYVSSMVIMLLYIAVFVLIFIIIRSLHRSSRSDSPLSPKCVGYTRAIGVIIMVIEIINSWGQWTMSKGAAEVLKGTAYTVDTTFTLNYYTLLLAALVIFTAEIFSIGSQLGEEQKLTI